MRKSISTAFFSMVSTLMVLGIVLMGCSEWVLFKNYFAKDRYETLDQVVNVAKRTAEYLVNSETMPQGAELDALNTKLEIIGESAEAYLFFTDGQGNVLIASDPDKLTTTTVPLDICQRANAVADPDAQHYHAFSDLGGALTEKAISRWCRPRMLRARSAVGCFCAPPARSSPTLNSSSGLTSSCRPA